MSTTQTHSSRDRLAPLLATIGETLGPNSDATLKFEKWALSLNESLVSAAKESHGALWAHVQMLKQELSELRRDITVGLEVTGRTELIRVCRREWLTHLVTLIEERFDLSGAEERYVA